MSLYRYELVALDLKLTSDYGDILPKMQIGHELFNLIENSTSIDKERMNQSRYPTSVEFEEDR